MRRRFRGATLASVSIPLEHQSLRNIHPRVAVLSMQPGSVHETVAHMLSTKYRLDAKTVDSPDPVDQAMLVREAQAVVMVGMPNGTAASSAAFQEAIAQAIPVLALTDSWNGTDPLPPGISFAIDPAQGPEYLATALYALISRQKEFARLQVETVSAMRFSGGLRHEISTIQGELQLAASVQREFLPRSLPSIVGVVSDALWRPAAYVSGDIYNVIRIDEHHLGFFVTDAVGHGVPAALLTLVISRTLPTKEIVDSSYRVLPPSEALSKVNADMMTRVGRTTRFATAIYGVMDTRTFELTVASAGHPPMIRLAPDGSMAHTQSEGGLLGVFADEVFTERSMTILEGEKLLFYTDGFEQAFPELGQDPAAPRLPNRRFLDVFKEFARDATPQEFIAHIEGRLDEESEDFPQIDDLTLLCVSRTGADGPTNS
ncbi:MAG: serine/threonine-protein phosphatase [Phycisphaerales bacterium]|nr:serine/threonine-protein phosphatase [Phycisphaerales bacterium]